MSNDLYRISSPLIPDLQWKPDRIFLNKSPRLWVNVLPKDPISARKSLYRMACYFRREFGYDFVQYDINEDDNGNHAAFVLTAANYISKDSVIGGMCFRKREKCEILKDHWGLQWVWIHPFSRNKGYLSRVWNQLNKTFPDFLVESPLSNAMKGFLKYKKCYDQHTDYRRLHK